MHVRLLSNFVLLGLGILSVSPPGVSAQDPQATIRAEVALVNVVFTAIDRKGRPVHDLKMGDFQIYENKELQTIEYFSALGKASDVPLTIALLIDTSGSVKDKLDFEKATAAEFFKEVLRPNKDLALIIQFDADVNLVQDFTQKQDDLLNALDSLKAGNSTALYDAVFLAAEEKLRKEVGRKVMVVITDGEDTSSRMRKEDAIQAAQKNDVLIYGIGVQGEEYGTNFGVLKKFAEETGGAFSLPTQGSPRFRKPFALSGRKSRGSTVLPTVQRTRKRTVPSAPSIFAAR